MLDSRVQRQISKLIDACSEGLIDKNEFEPRVRSARQHLEKLQADLRSQEQIDVQIQEMRLVIGHLESFAQRVRGRLENADWATRRHLLSTLVKRIEVGQEEIRVVYRVDCGPFDLAPSGGLGQDCWRRRRATRAPAGCHAARAAFPRGDRPLFIMPLAPCDKRTDSISTRPDVFRPTLWEESLFHFVPLTCLFRPRTRERLRKQE